MVYLFFSEYARVFLSEFAHVFLSEFAHGLHTPLSCSGQLAAECQSRAANTADAELRGAAGRVQTKKVKVY
jgi:hypothetical protein